MFGAIGLPELTIIVICVVAPLALAYRLGYNSGYRKALEKSIERDKAAN